MTRQPLDAPTLTPLPAADRSRLAGAGPARSPVGRRGCPHHLDGGGEARVQAGELERAQFSRRVVRGEPLVAWWAAAVAFRAHHAALLRAVPPPRAGQLPSPCRQQKERGR
jgi:hypothetical protein